jgi:plasmid stabilization system protein ParE
MRFWLEHGRRRLAPRRHSLPDRARGHEQREPAETHEVIKQIRRRIDALPEPPAAGRGQHVAGGRARVLRRRRRVPHGLPLPADAAHVHGRRAGRPPSRSSRSWRRRRTSPTCQWAIFLRNHDELTLEMVTESERDYMYSMYAADPRDAHQRRHPPPPGAADGQRPPRIEADEQPAAVDARLAGALLRRRDRHGRQHLPRRPQRRAHADAVDPRPQRRLLAGRPAATVPAADPGPDLRLRGGQRRSAVARAVVAAELDAPPARRAALELQAFGRGSITMLAPG